MTHPQPFRQTPIKAHASGRGLLCICALLFAVGCSGPSAANIELRKKNQDLQDQVQSLQSKLDADAQTIKSLESKSGTLPTLPKDRLDKLFTVHSIKLNKLTGGADFDNTPGHDGLKVYLTPQDDSGEPLKAAGSIIVEAFDLAASPTAIGKWEFDTQTTRQAWNGTFLSYQYVLKCPWQKPPQHEELTVKVTFHDELTGREFHQQTVVKITLTPTAR